MKKAFLTFAVSICALLFVGCGNGSGLDEYTRTKEFQVTVNPTVADNGVTIFVVEANWPGCKTTSSYVGNTVKGSGNLWFLAEVVCMKDDYIVIKIGYLGIPDGKQEYFSATIRVTEIVL